MASAGAGDARAADTATADNARAGASGGRMVGTRDIEGGCALGVSGRCMSSSMGGAAGSECLCVSTGVRDLPLSELTLLGVAAPLSLEIHSSSSSVLWLAIVNPALGLPVVAACRWFEGGTCRCV